MLTNGNKSDCGFADEIVSYIYDETGEPERRKFETHLAGCSTCTDEFAAISNARFSVFEWHKEEFAHLSTPQIVIPYAAARKTVDENAPGFFAGLRGLLTFPKFAFALAGIVACLGLGFLGLSYIGERQVADVSVDEQSTPPAKMPEAPAGTEILAVTQPKTTPDSITKEPNDVASNREVKPITTADNRRPKINRPLTADVRKPVDRAPGANSAQMRKAPVLSNYDDNDDKSLRLADLFDDGGVKR